MPVGLHPGRKTLLIFSQTFVPDPASVGQHMADVAFEMARRGHRVIVYTADRGYDDPSVVYPRSETVRGVEIRRLALSSFGKTSMARRLLAVGSFVGQCAAIALFRRGIDGILFSTSPPLIGVVAALANKLRSVPIAYWAMDLNPDQLIALGKLRPHSVRARVLESINRVILSRATLIIALDRFMAARLTARGVVRGDLAVIPPWPHEDSLAGLPRSDNPFRARHGVGNSLVVMYSGNHSPSNPLDTLLAAAVHFKNDPRLSFMFVGGGFGKGAVEHAIAENGLTNVISLPYQPLDQLGISLSAADVHVVSLGAEMVGIIHPCKIYGAMAVGRPILYFGPSPSHVSDILDRHSIGWTVEHGDVDGAIRRLEGLIKTPVTDLDALGANALRVLQSEVAQSRLQAEFCDRLERALALPGRPPQVSQVNRPTALDLTRPL